MNSTRRHERALYPYSFKSNEYDILKNMPRILKILSATALVLGLILPSSLFAQESAPTLLPEESSPVEATATSTDVPAVVATETFVVAQTGDASDVSVSPQTTAAGQESNAADALQETVNPGDVVMEDASSTVIEDSASSSSVPIADANTSSSIIVSDLSESAASSSQNGESNANASETANTSSTVTQGTEQASSTGGGVVSELANTQDAVTQLRDEPTSPVVSIVQKEPESKFIFRMKGGGIAAKRGAYQMRNEGGKRAWYARHATSTLGVPAAAQNAGGEVTDIPTVVPDTTQGALDISGTCTDRYFVVLVYANADDYSNNPGSYIFNKAFDCVGGRYSYSLKDFPSTLVDGTYYILIGGENEKDPWYPVSALMPVQIKREVQ